MIKKVLLVLILMFSLVNICAHTTDIYAYTEEETEMFRDVLYTTLDVEVAGWIRSLQLRGIELPDDLKDEVFLIIGERRI